MKEFLLATMSKRVFASRRFPAQWLPTTGLSTLLPMKQQMHALIDLLGLRDVASELRHIVNKTNQQILLRCLKADELKMLKYYMLGRKNSPYHG